MQIIKVLIPKAGLFPLDYKISKDINIEVGDLIIVPFRSRNITGVVWETNCSSSDKKLKIIDLTLNPADNNYKNIGLANIELIKKASSYYLASLGSIAKLVIPFDINLEVFQTKSEGFSGEHSLPNLSEEQASTLDFIKVTTKPVLLKGVTGSGKTEVYFHLVAETIKKGSQTFVKSKTL